MKRYLGASTVLAATLAAATAFAGIGTGRPAHLVQGGAADVMASHVSSRGPALAISGGAHLHSIADHGRTQAFSLGHNAAAFSMAPSSAADLQTGAALLRGFAPTGR